MSEEKIKCPFCKEIPTGFYNEQVIGGCSVYCVNSDCNVRPRTLPANSKKEALYFWNARPDSPAEEKLNEFLDFLGIFWDEKCQAFAYKPSQLDKWVKFKRDEEFQNLQSQIASLNARLSGKWVEIKDVSDLPKKDGLYLFQRRKHYFGNLFVIHEVEIQKEPQSSNVIGGAEVGESKHGGYEKSQFIAWRPLPEPFGEKEI